MTTIQPDYFTAYSRLKMTRDARGVLVAEFHTKGGPLTFTARDHTDFVEHTRICHGVDAENTRADRIEQNRIGDDVQLWRLDECR
jgi:hypothetical protein